VFTHTRRRWAFVRGLLAAGWREHGVPCIPFFYFFILFLFFFCRRHNCIFLFFDVQFYTPLSIFANFDHFLSNIARNIIKYRLKVH
jgi:hypothetical protein